MAVQATHRKPLLRFQPSEEQASQCRHQRPKRGSFHALNADAGFDFQDGGLPVRCIYAPTDPRGSEVDLSLLDIIISFLCENLHDGPRIRIPGIRMAGWKAVAFDNLALGVPVDQRDSSTSVDFHSFAFLGNRAIPA